MTKIQVSSVHISMQIDVKDYQDEHCSRRRQLFFCYDPILFRCLLSLEFRRFERMTESDTPCRRIKNKFDFASIILHVPIKCAFCLVRKGICSSWFFNKTFERYSCHTPTYLLVACRRVVGGEISTRPVVVS